MLPQDRYAHVVDKAVKVHLAVFVVAVREYARIARRTATCILTDYINASRHAVLHMCSQRPVAVGRRCDSSPIHSSSS
jgi:hypothetical protein